MHYEQRAKDRMVTDEHPGYDARAHWCGDAHYVQVGEQEPHDATLTVAGSDEVTYWRATTVPFPQQTKWVDDREQGGASHKAPRPNLRRVRAWAEWAQAAWRIVKWLLVFALGFALGVYAKSEVWK